MQLTERVRFSHLKRIGQSAKKYRHGVLEKEEKAAYAMGRLVHYLVLGGGDFVVWEEGDRRGKKWDLFVEEFRGKEIFKRSEVDEATRIADAVKNDPVVASLALLEGQHERLVHWEKLGRLCSSTLDIHRDGASPSRLVDSKTTTCAHPDKFPWESRRLHYPNQMAFYADALAHIGEPVDEVYLIAVEKEAPYEVTCFQLSPALLDEARKTNHLWFERLLACERADAWPGYVQHVVPMDVPREEGVTLLIDGEEVAA